MIMNLPLYKMLRFELKSQFRPTLVSSIIMVLFLTYFLSLMGQEKLIDRMFSMFNILTLLIIPPIYGESNQNYSMQMYHLIPVSLNIKFLAKLLVTHIIYPLLFTCLILVCGAFSMIIFGHTDQIGNSLSPKYSFYIYFVVWILIHSFITMTSIFFKKNKMMYGALSLLGVVIVLKFSELIIIGILGIKNSSEHLLSSSSDPSGKWIGMFVMSTVFYYISYRLFKKRQL